MRKIDRQSTLARDRKRGSFSLVAAAIISSAVILGGCADSASSAQNHDCAQHAQGTVPWGYYPGFGCGPVPRAQTVYP